MRDNMTNLKFSSPDAPKRTQRSNNGADDLFSQVLTSMFGISSDAVSELISAFQQSGQLSNVRKAVKLMPLSVHKALNDLIDSNYSTGDSNQSDEPLDINVAPTNDAPVDKQLLQKYVNRNNTDDWAPQDDKDASAIERGNRTSHISDDDYSAENRKDPRYESVAKLTFSQFLVEMIDPSNADAVIATAGSELDNQLDKVTLQRIRALQAAGNLAGASALRANALKRIQLSANPQQQQQQQAMVDPAVEQAKQNYARAIKNQQRKQQQTVAGQPIV
jgi:hypothetical protein